MWWRRRLTWGKAVWRRVSARPGVAHLLRAGSRYSDRLGSQFAGAITYFSFLSLVPIVMVSFAVGGYVLSAHPALLDSLKVQVTALLPGELGDSIGAVIDKAVQQRLAVGIVGLAVAGYSGLNWMGHIRDAVRAQWRPTWNRAKNARPNFVMSYVWDLVSLLGLLAAVLITFTLTAVGSAAQDVVIRLLGLQDAHWLSPVLTVGPFAVAIIADMLIFAWVYTILPPKQFRADRRTLLIGALAMSVSFEVLKAALTILVTRLSSSPSWAVFGSVIGLLFFFNLVAQAFLIIAAWIATGVEHDEITDGHVAGAAAAGNGFAPGDGSAGAADGSANDGAGSAGAGGGSTNDGAGSAGAGGGSTNDAAGSAGAADGSTRAGDGESAAGPSDDRARGARPVLAALGSGLALGWLVGRRRRR